MKIENNKALGITKSKTKVVNAFSALLQLYTFEELTITRICQEAEVARVTFYRNFETKEDILRLYIRALADDYFEKIKSVGRFDNQSLAHGYFEYWKQERELIDLLSKNNISNLLLDEFSLVESYLSDIRKGNPLLDQLGLTESTVHYFHAYNLAGLWRMIFVWAGRGYHESVEEMTSIYLKCINPNIQ